MSQRPDDGHERVGIVGGGRAALSLAVALAADQGERRAILLAIRDPHRAATASGWLRRAGIVGVEVHGTQPPAASTRWQQLDVVVFAVPDRAIQDAVRTATVAGWLRPDQRLLHLSGAAPVEDLGVAGHRHVAVMHPLAALRDPLLVPPGPAAVAEVRATLCGATFGLAGDGDALAVAGRWLDRWGSPRLLLGPQARVLWHAAAALVANDLVALLALGEALAARAGIPASASRPAQLHLARTALDAVRAESAGGAPLWQGLTGAVRRGDAGTLAHHLEVMEQIGAEGAAQRHRALSATLVELLAADEALPADRVAAMRAVLERPPSAAGSDDEPENPR